jgi:RPA family protein
MQSYQLVFTKDLNEGTRDRTTPGLWRSSSGIPCSRVFLCAALIERSRHPAGGLHLRIADPTGACAGYTSAGAQQVSEMIAGLPVPSFVTCAASVQARPGTADGGPVLHVEWMQEVPRRARDRWIIGTAMRTLTAIEQGGSSTAATAGLTAAIEQALSSVDPAECPATTPLQEHIDAAMDAISTASEGRLGADAEKVLKILSEQGISPSGASACITHLIEEGDCYCPQPGRLRIL